MQAPVANGYQPLPTFQPSYFGAADPSPMMTANRFNEDEDVLPIPVNNWEEEDYNARFANGPRLSRANS
jgi:hypothetical protein